VEQLQSHIWGRASYEGMRKYFPRRPLVIYYFAMLHSEFLFIWGKFNFLFYQCTIYVGELMCGVVAFKLVYTVFSFCRLLTVGCWDSVMAVGCWVWLSVIAVCRCLSGVDCQVLTIGCRGDGRCRWLLLVPGCGVLFVWCWLVVVGVDCRRSLLSSQYLILFF
jgi:hypothetical protein